MLECAYLVLDGVHVVEANIVLLWVLGGLFHNEASVSSNEGKKDSKCWDCDFEMVVETPEVEVDHGVGSLVFHIKDHGFLCRLGETTTVLVVMTLVEVVVLVQMAH